MSTNATQLRVATAGSVDDGKSTLIGRLLHDTRSLFDDQLTAMSKASRRFGDGQVNLALVTDGLRAEREQGITIDVAYRFFATPTRSFVLADTPGHAEYTRNMVTGASVSDVAVVLVDARHGVVEQTRRHVAISALLGVSHIVVAVNKMDLVDWSQQTFDEIVIDVADALVRLGRSVPLQALPISALHGDNVVRRSPNSEWYAGPSLLEVLESLEADTETDVGARLGVQWVIRAHGGSDHRSYAGRLSGGALAVGTEIQIATSGRRSTINELRVSGRPVDRAEPGDAVSISLRDQLDIGRGDLLVETDTRLAPTSTRHVSAELCWMTDTAVAAGSHWLAIHHHGETPIEIDAIESRLDLDSLTPEPANLLQLNDLGRVALTFAEPVALSRYDDHRSSGAMIIVDPRTNDTVAAAMVTTTSQQP